MTIETVFRRGRLFACGLAVGLTLVDAVASAQAGSGRAFERLDTDGNDVIEPREIEAARRATFERADANNDDYVTGPEIDALRAEIAQEYGRGGGGARQRAPEGTRQADRIKAIDTDGDGRISQAEFMSGRDALVLRFDGNGDGSVTRAEMEEGAAKVREEVRRRRGAQ
jgi:hypothetical protein